MKFIHAADIHLDSPLRGLERYDGAPVDEIRQATRRALENLVDLAIEEAVAFVVLAGDLYDGDWKDFKTGRFFLSQMFRLRDADIPVFLIAGNHDAANKMTRELDVGRAGVKMFDHRRPERVVLGDLGVALFGQSYAKSAVEDDLSAGYPAGDAGLFNIGLLHTCGPGQADGHARYAPCDLAGLQKKGYQYWALGHVHKRCAVADDPPVVFCGNLQGRHIREEGAKGCVLVEVDDRQRVTHQFRPLDVFRWKCCAVDATDAATADDLADRVRQALERALAEAEGRPLAVRLEIAGRCGAHEAISAEPARWEEEFRSLARDVGEGRVWLEKVRLATALAPERAAARWTEGPIAELLHTLDDIQNDPAELHELAKELEPLVKKLPSALSEGDDALGLTDPAAIRGVLDQVRELLAREFESEEASR